MKTTFGFIGTFGYWHGIEVLEKIIPILFSKNDTIQFLLIGDGHLKKQLQDSFSGKEFENSIVFTGIIPQKEAPYYLAQCDIFLCPTQPNRDGTRFFGSPTKLFEYMSMAKPIIASDLEQLSEIIQPAIYIKNLNQKEKNFQVTDEVGILVDPLNLQEFIDACFFVMNLSLDNRIRMGINARKKVLKNYTWEQHVVKIIKHAELS